MAGHRLDRDGLIESAIAASGHTDRPCPPPSARTYATDPRIAEVQAAIDLAGSLIPGFSATR